MPLKPGSDRNTISANISEFHHGATYERTKEKFGKATADKQAVAAAMSNARRHPGGAHAKRPKTRLARM
jgi:aminoglycoside phosphotransferase family enzyme